MNRILVIAAATWLFSASVASAEKHTIELTVSAGKTDQGMQPVCIPLQLPASFKGVKVAVLEKDDKFFAPVQLTDPGLATQSIKAEKDKVRRDLHFILPELKAGSSLTLKALLGGEDKAGKTAGEAAFAWSGSGAGEGEYSELRLGKRPVLRFMHAALDESSAAKRTATFKVFHHVYDPAGTRFATKGVGGKFTHHRGLFYGFMKTGYDKNTVDIWHCKGDTHQAYKGSVEEAGKVLGRHLVTINWNGVGKKTFAVENRELTAYNVKGGNLIDFVSLLTPTDGPVKLDGDPQHAGFHFRADNEVAAKTKKETIFIRPDGVGKPGTEVNWPKDKKHVNLPWLAMSFVLGGKRYTAAYLDQPTNPKEARFSERTYGRMGSYFVTTVTKEKPLLVKYRIWLQEGQMTPEEVASRSRTFVEPVEVKVK